MPPLFVDKQLHIFSRNDLRHEDLGLVLATDSNCLSYSVTSPQLLEKQM